MRHEAYSDRSLLPLLRGTGGKTRRDGEPARPRFRVLTKQRPPTRLCRHFSFDYAASTTAVKDDFLPSIETETVCSPTALRGCSSSRCSGNSSTWAWVSSALTISSAWIPLKRCPCSFALPESVIRTYLSASKFFRRSSCWTPRSSSVALCIACACFRREALASCAKPRGNRKLRA